MQGQTCLFQLSEFVWDTHRSRQKLLLQIVGFSHMLDTQFFRRKYPTGAVEEKKGKA